MKWDANKLPWIDDLIDRIVSSKIFLAFDYQSGFWQWALELDSMILMVFLIPFRT